MYFILKGGFIWICFYKRNIKLQAFIELLNLYMNNVASDFHVTSETCCVPAPEC